MELLFYIPILILAYLLGFYRGFKEGKRIERDKQRNEQLINYKH